MVLRSRAYAIAYGIFRCGRLKTSAQVNFADSIILWFNILLFSNTMLTCFQTNATSDVIYRN